MIEQMTFEEILNDYFEYRAALKLKEKTTLNLKTFFNACRKNYPDDLYLTQEMVDTWSEKRDTESPASYMSRIGPIVSFIRYAIAREWIDIIAPKIKRTPRKPYIPHFFTYIPHFFTDKACEDIGGNTLNYTVSRLRRLEVPVFFRLLYSSGLRSIEARLLRCENVNLVTGVINVIFTKGYHEHRVVLHDSMLELLIQYDKAISQIIPNRKIFFPTLNDMCHHKSWVPRQFNKAWSKYNKTSARTGDIRHFYAYMNINSWTNVGYDVHDKLLALSKSMGHTSMRHTIYYFSLRCTTLTSLKNLSKKLCCH